ncbi:hypothetical protein PG985_015467 [Apiospora marii]|uniref:Uncharacterized protein n=1 Tax=Apiospora marii TaxID=335849 RepID=A0ABR1S5C1_9PEZI
MSSASTISSSTRPMSRDQHDTGFPESFASRTTSMRHPDANTSPGACISAEDIDPAKTLHRSRRSLLLRKHRRTISHGVITAEAAAEYQNDSAVDVNESKDMLPYDDILRPLSKDSSISVDRVDSRSVKGGSPPSSPAQSSRRRSMFQKWRGQKA